MNNIQEAQLLRENRSALVERLRDLGITEVDENTPLSEMAELMRWCGGLRDIRLATINKSSGEYADYNEAEWEAMSASQKAGCIKLGVRIRAERQDFIIAKENATRADGSITMPWGGSGYDVKGLTNYGDDSTGHLKDMDGEANTDLILAHAAANNLNFEAAERARAYKAATFADGGFDDTTKWSLPAIGQLFLIYKYKKQINAALTTFFGSVYAIPNDWLWSSTEYNAYNAWYLTMNTGYANNYLKAYMYRVRAVARVPASAASGSAAITNP